MTGTSARTHGDRTFREHEPMDPSLPTMAQTFRDAGYQAYAVGKLHVYPQRDRIGFDDVILNEEGRHHLGGGSDDYERYLHDHGHGGQEADPCHGQQQLHGKAVAPERAVPPDVLDHPADVRDDPPPRPDPAGVLVLLVRGAAPADHAAGRLSPATTSTSAWTSRSSANGRRDFDALPPTP